MGLDPHVIVTYTGRTINPLAPNPDDISIVDIAHALGNQCRFTGHTKEFYSVAEHSFHVANMVPDSDALWGLLHDGTEAYLADIARPIKRATGAFSAAYEEAETRLMEAIAVRFDLPKNNGIWHAIPRSVKTADNVILKQEMLDLMPALCSQDIEVVDLEGVAPSLLLMSPHDAKRQFLIKFAELTDTDMMID